MVERLDNRAPVESDLVINISSFVSRRRTGSKVQLRKVNHRVRVQSRSLEIKVEREIQKDT